MNKKLALVTLIHSSIMLSDEAKLELLSRVEAMTQKHVEVLGKFLADEQRFIANHDALIRQEAEEIIASLEKDAPP